MEVKIDVRPRSKNVMLVAVRGKIGSETVEVFKQELEKIVLSGNTRLILGLKEVTYLNSTGLGVLASMLRLVKKKWRY
jgi:anti-anti-sigma factor